MNSVLESDKSYDKSPPSTAIYQRLFTLWVMIADSLRSTYIGRIVRLCIICTIGSAVENSFSNYSEKNLHIENRVIKITFIRSFKRSIFPQLDVNDCMQVSFRRFQDFKSALQK